MRPMLYRNGTGLTDRLWAFQPSLFQTVEFAHNQFPDGGFVSVTAENNDVIHGIMHFALGREGWVSLPRSPFGGVGGSGSLVADGVRQMVDLAVLESHGAPMSIFLPFGDYPGCHVSSLRASLLDSGFSVSYRDIHHYIDLTDSQADENLHASQRRRLDKCRKGGFVFREELAEGLEEMYAFIGRCRQEQSIPLNVSLEHLQTSWRRLPGVYSLFSVRSDGQLAAACITARVSGEVLYYFLPASDRAFSDFSPMVLLVHELVHWARGREFGLLDMGRSSIEGREQAGLSVFKERMGARRGAAECLVRRR